MWMLVGGTLPPLMRGAGFEKVVGLEADGEAGLELDEEAIINHLLYQP